MGIDVYLKWPKQTKKQEKSQITGWRTDAGGVGYLREAYHGGPYATRVLMPEGFADDAPEDGPEIPAKVLRERLPATVMTAIYRNYAVYEQGKNPGEIELGTAGLGGDAAGEVLTVMKGALAEIANVEKQEPLPPPTEEQAAAVNRLIAARALPDYAMSFADFVALAEKMEDKYKQPCKVYVSY